MSTVDANVHGALQVVIAIIRALRPDVGSIELEDNLGEVLKVVSCMLEELDAKILMEIMRRKLGGLLMEGCAEKEALRVRTVGGGLN